VKIPSALSSMLVAAALGITAVGCAHHKEKEENDVVMKLDEVPAAVREGLTREAGGATIDKVDKEMANGKTVYEVDVMRNGKNWEIKVDEAGKLVSKKPD
jgi:uncharacterized membrane protein YkoI